MTNKLILIDTVSLPAYALPYLINGDASAMTFDCIREIDTWLGQYDEYAPIIFNAGDVTFFTHEPAFGLACDCVVCELFGYENIEE